MLKIAAWPAFKNKYKNPYNWLLYSHMSQADVSVREFSPKILLRENCDILHFHWPVEMIVDHPNWLVAFLRSLSLILLMKWVKFRGTRIIWSFHNELPHSTLHPQLANWFQGLFIHQLDGYISLCRHGQGRAKKLFPTLKKLPCWIIPHGHYQEIYPNSISKVDARARLRIPEGFHSLVFLGQIRPYKNVPRLIRIFRELAPLNWQLSIAGMANSTDLRESLFEAADKDARVKFFLDFVPDDEIQIYLNAADLVVLPFESILNSGSAILALSFNRPILVPNIGAMEELQSLVGKEWVALYSGDFAAEALSQGLSWAVNTPRSVMANLEALDWGKISKETVSAYEALVRDR